MLHTPEMDFTKLFSRSSFCFERPFTGGRERLRRNRRDDAAGGGVLPPVLVALARRRAAWLRPRAHRFYASIPWVRRRGRRPEGCAASRPPVRAPSDLTSQRECRAARRRSCAAPKEDCP